MEAVENSDFRKSLDSVFGNSLVVNRICSFTTSVKDLRNFRFLNRVFYREATKKLRLLCKAISISRFDLGRFLICLQGRFEPDINPFPFTSFSLDINFPRQDLMVFLIKTGVHIRRLVLRGELSDDGDDQVKKNLAVIFYYTYQNLERFDLFTSRPVELSTQDLRIIPVSFPRLRAITIGYHEESNSSEPNSVPLLSYLITRARVLEAVSVLNIKGIQGQDSTLNGLRLIIQNHRHHLPAISLSKTNILPSNLPALRELTEMGFTFRNFCVEFEAKKASGVGRVQRGFNVQNIRKCLTWLGSQASKARVTSLVLGFDAPYQNLILAIPSLPVLTELELDCNRVSILIDNDTCPIQPFANNPFPVLQKLTLNSYKDSYGIFDQCRLPSVQRLYIYNYSSPITLSWNTILPNLTFLSFEVESSEDYFEFEEDHSLQNLTFILTHFPMLTDLVLDLGKDEDYWDVLTGGSPEPTSTEELLKGVLDDELEPLEEPVDGVYQTPSLRNFRALKSLGSDPRTRSSLDAIIYMTRTGRIVPLERMTLFGIKAKDFDIKFKELEAYQTELRKVHSKVDILVKQLEYQDQVNWWKRYVVSPVLLPDYNV